jgi:hypothetical protein
MLAHDQASGIGAKRPRRSNSPAAVLPLPLRRLEGTIRCPLPAVGLRAERANLDRLSIEGNGRVGEERRN